MRYRITHKYTGRSVGFAILDSLPDAQHEGMVFENEIAAAMEELGAKNLEFLEIQALPNLLSPLAEDIIKPKE